MLSLILLLEVVPGTLYHGSLQFRNVALLNVYKYRVEILNYCTKYCYFFHGGNSSVGWCNLTLYTVSLVVNVASECGYTDSHYKALQQLQRDLGPYHFNVLAFPCNQFGQQEPDSNKEIESFARKTYGASFPMFSKTAVSGAGAIPAFKYLIEFLWHKTPQQTVPWKNYFNKLLHGIQV
uniref:Glutathione peroxidase n=1 Tax=Apteryx owenii TaxID=8824 RepID=A0A8B9S6P4_APTOW